MERRSGAGSRRGRAGQRGESSPPDGLVSSFPLPLVARCCRSSARRKGPPRCWQETGAGGQAARRTGQSVTQAGSGRCSYGGWSALAVAREGADPHPPMYVHYRTHVAARGGLVGADEQPPPGGGRRRLSDVLEPPGRVVALEYSAWGGPCAGAPREIYRGYFLSSFLPA